MATSIKDIPFKQWNYFAIGIYGCLATLVVGIVDKQKIIIIKLDNQ